MKNPVARKLGMNCGMSALVIAPPPGYLKLLSPLPDGLNNSSRAAGIYPFVQVFATPASQLYGEYELVRLLYLIPSLASWHR